MNAACPNLVGSTTKVATLGKGAGASFGAGAGTVFGTSPWGFQAACGAIVGMGILFPLVLVAAVGYLGYKACTCDSRKIPGSGFSPLAPEADSPLTDGRLINPGQNLLAEACRNIVGS
jgi:hypothetical protein